MADPISIIGAIAAILDISKTVVSIIKSAKDSSSDRQKLLADINSTTAVCQTLKDYADMDAETVGDDSDDPQWSRRPSSANAE